VRFLSEIFDFVFAPAGAFDPESSFSVVSHGSIFGQVQATAINPATGLPMIDGAGIDVSESVFCIDVHHYNHGNCGQDSNTFIHDCGSMVDHSSTSFSSGSIFDI